MKVTRGLLQRRVNWGHVEAVATSTAAHERDDFDGIAVLEDVVCVACFGDELLIDLNGAGGALQPERFKELRDCLVVVADLLLPIDRESHAPSITSYRCAL